MVVVCGEFPQREAAGDRVTYLHGDELVRWLRAQPIRMHPDVVIRVGGVFDRAALAA